MVTNDSEKTRLTKPFQLLSCAIPNSVKRFAFRAVLYAKQKRGYLAICSSNKIGGPKLVDRQSVHNVNVSIPRAYLAMVAFYGTLSQWIVMQEKNGELMFCKFHDDWLHEIRPKEELRRIIYGILELVCELHENNSFHGHLGSSENFAFSLVDDYCGRGDIQHVEVTLINASDYGSKTDAEIQKGKRGKMKDLKDLHKLILTTLLGFTAEGIDEAKADIEKANRRKLQKKLPALTGNLGYDDNEGLNSRKCRLLLLSLLVLSVYESQK